VEVDQVEYAERRTELSDQVDFREPILFHALESGCAR
jgi:hypothetical protein